MTWRSDANNFVFVVVKDSVLGRSLLCHVYAHDTAIPVGTQTTAISLLCGYVGKQGAFGTARV